MAIINGKRSTQKDRIKAMVCSDTVKQINEYCEWANIDDIGFFIEESAAFIFSKDKEWKDHKRSKNKEAV